jgi:hypothetical protein
VLAEYQRLLREKGLGARIPPTPQTRPWPQAAGR